MEFLLELLLTAAISFVFAFFLAKLISLASAPDHDRDFTQQLISAVDPSRFPLCTEKAGAASIEEVKCEEKTRKRRSEGAMSKNGNETEMNFYGQDAAIVRGICGEALKEEAGAVRVCERAGLELGGRLPDDVEFCGGLLKRRMDVESARSSGLSVETGCLGEGNGAAWLKPDEIDLKEAERGSRSDGDGEFGVGSVKEEVRVNREELEAKEEKKSGESDVRSVKEELGLNKDGIEAKKDKKSESDGGFDVGSVVDEVGAAEKDGFEATKEKQSKSHGEFDAGLVKEESRSSKDGVDVVEFDRSDGDFGEEENVVEKGRADEKGSLFDDDEEWEGIEKSELEKQFGEMASRVASGSGNLLSKIGSDVQMQLYGLHKVATEGPCNEPQPSMLKGRELLCVSDGEHWLRCARHAWQRLGNMNPEVAMEQYINLLSDSIPGWIGEKAEGKVEPNDSLKEPVSGSKAPDLSSSLHHLTSAGNERKSEVHPCVAEVDDINGEKFPEHGCSRPK